MTINFSQNFVHFGSTFVIFCKKFNNNSLFHVSFLATNNLSAVTAHEITLKFINIFLFGFRRLIEEICILQMICIGKVKSRAIVHLNLA